MKLNPNFIVHSTEEEVLLVPTGKAGFSGIVRGNQTLGFILEQLKSETTEEKMAAAMLERWDVSEEAALRDLRQALAELKKIGALDE